MWLKLIIGVVAFRVMCSLVNASSNSTEPNIPSLPFCPNKNGSGVILVSTLDGKLSALNSSGQLKWEIETGPGPLLISNIHKLELTNNGEWIRIIPSLAGTLYKFDGNTIDPISISAEALLRSSFRYSDDLVIAGGLEVRTYGVGFNSGKMLYECNQSKCSTHEKEEMDDVLIIERTTQTIRAVEPRTGYERWNFSVGLHNIKLPQVSCIDPKLFNPNITAVVPEGLLSVSLEKNGLTEKWQYRFNAPIVRVWNWNGMELNEVNLFLSKNAPQLVTPTSLLPSIYIGIHKKQLYIYESLEMQSILKSHTGTELIEAESTSLTKIPWKPISASNEITEDDSTALSVLHNSEYVNGNGYYLYTEQALKEKDSQHCEKNHSNVIDTVDVEEEAIYTGFLYYLSTYLRYYKEFVLMVFTILIVSYKVWTKNHPKHKEIIIIEKPVEARITTRPDRQISDKSEGFTSRFQEDYDTIQCLGKGGFGVVFEVKQKYDDCHYAIKRITLPNEETSRDRVMREVKALAKLDHKNIVRYFSCWLEHPPLGWEEEHDKNYLELSMSGNFTASGITKSTAVKRTKSHSICIPLCSNDEPSFDSESDHDETGYSDDDDDDSFVVFENDEDESNQTESTAICCKDELPLVPFKQNTTSKYVGENDEIKSFGSEAVSLSEHLQKKINWKRPERKHYSWDLSQTNLMQVISPTPPTYLYIQMQLCQKESLKEWLHSHYNRDYSEMLKIFSQIIDAVEYVHLRKLIHRDLKPSNIFFSLDGQIKVGDFGLVKDVEGTIDKEFTRRNQSASYRGHTREVGTQLYMSPEQFKGKLYDYKVDIYSLGIILFELLVPFKTDMERIKTLTDLKGQKYPEGFQNKFPSEFSLLQEMLNENPSKRLTTIGIKARKPFSKNYEYSPEEDYNLKSFHM